MSSTNNPTQPDSNPDTAEAKIEKVIDDAFNIGAGRFPEDYKNLKKGMVAQLKGLLVDAKLQTIDKVFTLSPTEQFQHWKPQDAVAFYERLKEYEHALQQTRQEEVSE